MNDPKGEYVAVKCFHCGYRFLTGKMFLHGERQRLVNTLYRTCSRPKCQEAEKRWEAFKR